METGLNKRSCKIIFFKCDFILAYLAARLPPNTNNFRPVGAVIDSDVSSSVAENLIYMTANNQLEPSIPSNNT